MPNANLERTVKAMKRIPVPCRADPACGISPAPAGRGQASALHLLLMLLAVAAVRGLGQTPQHAEPVISPEVHPDRSTGEDRDAPTPRGRIGKVPFACGPYPPAP